MEAIGPLKCWSCTTVLHGITPKKTSNLNQRRLPI